MFEIENNNNLGFTSEIGMQIQLFNILQALNKTNPICFDWISQLFSKHIKAYQDDLKEYYSKYFKLQVINQTEKIRIRKKRIKLQELPNERQVLEPKLVSDAPILKSE